MSNLWKERDLLKLIKRNYNREERLWPDKAKGELMEQWDKCQIKLHTEQGEWFPNMQETSMLQIKDQPFGRDG